MANIVLIEPNTVLATTYRRALQTAGHIVRRAAGAQAAIELADEQVPDLVVLDLQLSGHSGIEFLHEFRSYPEWQSIPLIINTGLSHAVLAPMRHILTRDFGVGRILYKPKASLEELLRAVDEQLL